MAFNRQDSGNWYDDDVFDTYLAPPLPPRAYGIGRFHGQITGRHPSAFTRIEPEFDIILRGGKPWGFDLGNGSSGFSSVTVTSIDTTIYVGKSDTYRIEPKGKADIYGLRTGDRLRRINDVPVVEVDDATQIINSAFTTLTLTVKRGNAEQSSAPKSSSSTQELSPDNESGSKDDSIVYAESRSKSGSKHRPKRRGESFNLRATNRPQSWQAGSPSLNPNRPRNRRSFDTRQSASVSEVNRLPSSSSINNATSSDSMTTSSSVSSGQPDGMYPSAKSTPSLHYLGGLDHGEQGISTSESRHGGETVAHSHQNLAVDPGNMAQQHGQHHGMQKSYSYSNASERPGSWDCQPPRQRRSFGSDSGMGNSSQDLRNSYPYSRGQRGYSANNYENMNEFQQQAASGAYGGHQWQGALVPNETNFPDAAPGPGDAGDRGTPSPPAPPVRDASSLRYIKVSQSHEKYPSWPVTATQSQSAKPMNSRTNSWSENTATTSEFPSKPRMAYNPALSTHHEEKFDTPETARKYFEDNGVITQGGESSEFHQAVVDKLQGDLNIRQKFPINSHGELDIKNFKNDQPSYPYPRYDKDGKIKDIDKDYAVPSPPERDIPSRLMQTYGASQVTQEPSGQWNQYSNQPGAGSGEQVPPLPSSAPPPMSSSTVTPDPSQSFTSNVQLTLGGSNTGSGYPKIVKSRPFYNTSTQTDTQTGGQDDTSVTRKKPQREEKSVQVRQQSLIRGVNLDEITGNNNEKAASPNQSYSPASTANASTSPKDASPSFNFAYQPVQSRDQRSAPVVDRLQQENRIPETISEGEEVKPGAHRTGLQDELDRIHEHSPSQTSMLRKLSQELYYGQQTRYGMGMTNRLAPPSGRERKASGDSPSNDANRPPELKLQPAPGSPLQDPSPESPQSPKVSPFERRSKVQMSLRKAYGIFDEIENYDPSAGRKILGKHAKSASTSKMPSTTPAVVHKSEGSLDGRSNYADYADLAKAQQWQKNPTSTDTRVIAEQARQDWRESGQYRAYESANNNYGLKRTTSEQIRPIKERQMNKARRENLLRNENKHKLSDPESAQEKRHKISDPVPPSEAIGFGDRHSDPTPGKRLSSESSDVFRNSGGFEGRRLSGPRNTSSNSSMDEKSLQQHALLSFYEKKTGKRLSSSSMDSSVSGSDKSVIKAHSPSPQRIDGRKGFSLPRDAVPPTFDDTKRYSAAEGEMSPPPLLDTTTPGDRSSYNSRTSSQSALSPGLEYSPPLHPWGPPTAHDPKRNPLIGTPGKSALGGSAETSPASTLVIHHSKQNSEEKDKSTNMFDDPATHPKAMMAMESSSTSTSPNRPTSQEVNQTFGYQVTVNQSYADDEEDKPPSLPPRNYRQPLSDRNARERPQPPLPPTAQGETITHPHSFRSNVMTNDYDQTPKPDTYADQLRAQARRISQGPRGYLNPARFQQKSLPDTKTSISVSRPVDRQPTAQETSTPQPLLAGTQPGITQSISDSRLSSSSFSAGSTPISSTSPQSRTAPVPQKLFTSRPESSSPGGRPAEGRLSNPTSLNNSANSSPRPLDSPSMANVSLHSQRSPAGPGPSPSHPLAPHSYLSEKAIPPHSITSDLNGMERWPDGHSPENSSSQAFTTDSYISYKKPGNVRLGFGGNYRRSGSGDVSPVKSPLSPNLAPSEDTKPPLGEASLRSPGQVPLSRYEETDLDRPHETRYIEAPKGELPWQKVKVVHTPKMDFLPQGAATGEASLDNSMPLAPSHSESTSRYPSQNPRYDNEVGESQEEPIVGSPSVRAFAANFESGKFSPKPQRKQFKLDTPSDSKVSDLRESILRKSNENLLQSVESSGSRERLHRLSPATSRDRLDKLAGSSTSSSQEFKEKVDSKNTINLQSRTDNVSVEQHGYLQESVADVIQQEYSMPASSQPLVQPPSPAPIEKDTLCNMEDEVFVKHPRQKSQEEMVYEQQAALLASQLRDKDKQLSEVIQPPKERKMSVDYMSGLFKKEVKLNRRPSFLSSRPPGDGSEDVLPPPDVVPLNKSENSTPEFSLETQKEQLASSLENKLRILRQERKILGDEIKENKSLGATVTSIVEKKAQQRECSKYKSYVDELDKVMHLLIFLSDKLAKAENDLSALPSTASDAEKERLVKKRDQMSEKHEDAKSLKEGIDRRSRQVATYLKSCLTEDEFTDYEYFIQMKSKLNMEKQEIEDKIKLGEEQLNALQKSLNISEA